MKPAYLSLSLVFAASLFGQVVPIIVPNPVPVQFPAAIRLYLELTDAQVDTIRDLNTAYNQFTTDKYRRMSQVQQEIAAETAKSPLDPMALGVRYAEVETIRRQLQEELQTTRERIRQTLTDPQRAKLKTLEDISKLLPLYSEAVGVNLLEQSGIAGNILPPTRVIPGFTFTPGLTFTPAAAQQPQP